MSIMPRCALLACVLVASSLPAAAPPAAGGAAGIARLLRKLDAENFYTRQRADASLRALGKGAVPLLKQELERAQSPEVRWRLGRIVHDLTIDERIPSLVEMLGHSNSQFRDQADWALRQGGPAVVPLLEKELKPRLGAGSRQRLERIIAELSVSRR